MLLQPSLNNINTLSFSSTAFRSRNLNLTPHQIPNYRRPQITITCSSSVSKLRGRKTVDYETRPMTKWNAIYKSISMMDNRELGPGSVLTQLENEGQRLTKWELCRVVKELRKFKHFKLALEVYNWMGSREYPLTASDAAIQLDLIAKVHGVTNAENFFMNLSGNLKDRRIYGALLNAYVQARMKEKAESMMDEMRQKGYIIYALPFNVMMTLYMNLKEYDKVESMISEMKSKKIRFDLYSYNIWLSSRGFQGFAEKMEEVFEQMKRDKTVTPNWTTFSTMANMYVKMGLPEKAEECLRRFESTIKGRDRAAYHYLLSLYGAVGKKDEIYRVWNVYNSLFPTITNLGYRVFMTSLVRAGDLKGAEATYEQWLLTKSSYDTRIGNIFMEYYVKDGNMEEAESFFRSMTAAGGKPNSHTWEILAEEHIAQRRISKALSCLKEDLATAGLEKRKPKPTIISAFFNLCDEEGDVASKEGLETLLKESGYLQDDDYASLIRTAKVGSDPSRVENKTDNVEDTYDGSELLLVGEH